MVTRILFCALGIALSWASALVSPARADDRKLPYVFVPGEEDCDHSPLYFSPDDLGLRKYFKIICENAKRTRFDWRLVAAVIHQESDFNSRAVSKTRARGLMQLKSFVALQWRVTKVFDPAQNVRGGTDHLRWGFDSLCIDFQGIRRKDKSRFQVFQGATAEDTVKLGIGMYNLGMGNTAEAQKVAINQNRNQRLWDDIVDMFLLMKNRKRNRKPHGYNETKPYVENILADYATYVDRYPPATIPSPNICGQFVDPTPMDPNELFEMSPADTLFDSMPADTTEIIRLP